MADERPGFSFLTVFVVTVACGYAFYRVHHALAPFVLAAAFAYVINPAVTYFEARGLRRAHLIVVGYLAALALGFAAYSGLKGLIVAETEFLQSRGPSYIRQLEKTLVSRQALLTKELPLPPAIAEKALETVVGGALEKAQELPSHLFALVPFLAHALLIPFIGFFFLLDGNDGVESLIQTCPSRLVEQAIHLLSEIDTALGNYLRGILIVALAIAVASFGGLFLMGVDNAVLIAVVSGVSSFVPYLGAVVGMLLGGGLAFYQFGTFAAFLKVTALFAGIRLADEIFLQPVIARHSVHLHPMVFLVSLVLGGEMFGFLGLVFAVPAACILKALVKVGWSWYTSERAASGVDTFGQAEVPYT